MVRRRPYRLSRKKPRPMPPEEREIMANQKSVNETTAYEAERLAELAKRMEENHDRWGFKTMSKERFDELSDQLFG